MTSKNIDNDGSFTYREKYQKPIGYENVLTEQLNRIAVYRSGRQWEKYEDSIITLIYMMPMDLRKKIIDYRYDNQIETIDISDIGIRQYDDLWMYVNKLLEEANLIFHTTYLKTYE